MRYSFSALGNEKILSYPFAKENEILIPYKKYLELENKEEFKNIAVVLTAADIEHSVDCIWPALKNVKICFLNVVEMEEYLPDLIENNLSYFCYICVDNWDSFNSLINMQVTDIYIGDSFAFDYDNILMMAKRHNITIRIHPNVAQAGEVDYSLNYLSKFFIRPEDIGLYDNENTMFTFFGPEDRQKVLYEIYNSRYWKGDLKDLIIGLGESFDNNKIPPLFGEIRKNCKKKCSYGKCILCERVKSFHDDLAKTPIVINRPKMKEIIDEHRRDEAFMQLATRQSDNGDGDISEG